MTIRTKALTDMLALETAADNWFSKLSTREQEAYKKAHPKSKFSKTVAPKAEAAFDAKGNKALEDSTTAALKSAGLNHRKTYGDSPMMAPHDFWNIHDYEPSDDKAEAGIHKSLTGLGYEKKGYKDMKFSYYHPVHRHSVYQDDVAITHVAPTEHGFMDS